MFLIEKDYKYLIRDEVLNVVQEDEATRQQAELASVEEVKSYLDPQYATELIFLLHSIWSPLISYNFNAYVLLTAAAYINTQAYAVDDLIEFEGSIFICIDITTAGEDPTSTPAKWTNLGTDCSFFTALKTQRFEKEIIYEVGEFVFQESKRYEVVKKTTGLESPDTDTNNEFFTLNTDTVPAGTLPTDTDFWTLGDTRSPLIVRYVIDITLYELHSRINPRNIPEFRIQRRDDAISYLKNVANPRMNIQADLPFKLFKDKQGTDITWNSNPKIDHGQRSY